MKKLDLIIAILCGINIAFAILNQNWAALGGWIVGGLGHFRLYSA